MPVCSEFPLHSHNVDRSSAVGFLQVCLLQCLRGVCLTAGLSLRFGWYCNAKQKDGSIRRPHCCQKRRGHQKRRGLIKITRNNWKQKTEQSRFPVVSRDFDKPAAFLAALGPFSRLSSFNTATKIWFPFVGNNFLIWLWNLEVVLQSLSCNKVSSLSSALLSHCGKINKKSQNKEKLESKRHENFPFIPTDLPTGYVSNWSNLNRQIPIHISFLWFQLKFICRSIIHSRGT
jgi:hypothetical protein